MVACIDEGVSCISIERDNRQHMAALRVVQTKIDGLQLLEQNYQEMVTVAEDACDAAPVDTVLPPSHDRVFSVIHGALMDTVVVPSPPEENEQFGNACLKCAKPPTDPENPLFCFLCNAPRHAECMWASVVIHEEGDVNAKITAYACTKVCWIGMGQDADYVPPACHPPAAVAPVATLLPPAPDASDNIVPGTEDTSKTGNGLADSD